MYENGLKKTRHLHHYKLLNEPFIKNFVLSYLFKRDKRVTIFTLEDVLEL